MLTKKSELIHIISMINLAHKSSKNTIVIKKRNSFSSILNILSRSGVIKTYKEFPSLLVIKLNPTKALISLVLSNGPLSCRNNILLQQKGSGAFYVLSTSKGIMTSLASSEHNIGGKLLFKIY